MIRIIDDEDQYQPEFSRMNREWLDQYGLTESHDLEVLEDPRGTIIEPGGYIFLAMDEDQIVGTAVLIREREGEYELVKMFVSKAYRGQGISKLLIEKCLQQAAICGATRVFLYSNSQLQAAIHLYANYGFHHIDPAGGPFLTADVKMERFF